MPRYWGAVGRPAGGVVSQSGRDGGPAGAGASQAERAGGPCGGALSQDCLSCGPEDGYGRPSAGSAWRCAASRPAG